MRCFVRKVQFLFAVGIILRAVSARASVLFYDDFQQFPSGTVLTQTNYLPNIGIDATIQTNTDGFNVPTVIASNFLGSVRAFFNVGSLPYSAQYRGDQNGGPLTNEDYKLTFLLWIPALKNASHLGGFAVDALTTNIDFVDNGTTNYNSSPLIFLNDGGQVYAFTNNPSLVVPLQTVVQIGSWSAGVGTVMTNAITVSFTSNTYSYAINGTTLTNMPLPGYITNVLGRVGFEVFEGFTGAGIASLGNRFALDNIKLTAGPADTNQDVVSYIAAAKGQFFDQLTAGVPTLSTTGWAFHSDVEGSTSNSLLDTSLAIPGGAVKTLQPNSPGAFEWEFNDQFTSQASLDAAYPSDALYTLTVDTADQGTFRPSLHLPVDQYPTNAPQIVNFVAAQAINSSSDFLLQWTALTGGTTDDFISVSVEDNQGNTPFNTPDIGATNGLDGTATSVLIPGNTLAPSTTYQGSLLFVKRTNTDAGSIPGALGLAGFFKQTTFPLATTSAAAPSATCALAPAVGTNTINSTYTATATVTTNGTPVTGVLVNFSVIAGPNLGNTGTGTTDGSGHANFGYASAVTGTDTVQAAGSVSSLSFTGTATEVWLGTNIPPNAICQNITVAAGAGCVANVSAAQVDNGSSDPDGLIVNRVLAPPGPYAFGTNSVTLTVTDDRGATNSCSATIVVVDQTPPTITCPANIVTNVLFGVTNAVVNYPAPTISDNCSGTSTNFVPPSGSTFALGTNQVTITAVDGSGNTNSCNFNVIISQVAPQADLAVTAASNVATASLNNAFGFTLTVTNKGPQDATGAQLVDTLPAGVSFNSATSTVGSCTNIGGVITCSFGTLVNGATASVSVDVTPTDPTVTSACSTATVTNSLLDPVSANNSVNACMPVVIDNLAVTAFKAPKKLALSVKKPSVISKLAVTIQNRSLHAEVIPDIGVLSNLVTVSLSALGTNVCSLPVAQLVTPKAFPITLAPGKSLKLAYTVTFTCATDPLATSKTGTHNDYQYLVTVHHEALDGILDSRSADDTCPHDALGADPYNTKIKDKGCGVKQPDGSFGPVVTDITDSRTP